MEVLKVKDWIKNKDQQFIPKEIYQGEILTCIRIKDNKKFAVSITICISTIQIEDTNYRIDISITRMSADCIYVELSGKLTDGNNNFENSIVSKLIKINEIEKWLDSIIQATKIKSIMNPELLYIVKNKEKII